MVKLQGSWKIQLRRKFKNMRRPKKWSREESKAAVSSRSSATNGTSAIQSDGASVNPSNGVSVSQSDGASVNPPETPASNSPSDGESVGSPSRASVDPTIGTSVSESNGSVGQVQPHKAVVGQPSKKSKRVDTQIEVTEEEKTYEENVAALTEESEKDNPSQRVIKMLMMKTFSK